LQHDKLLRYDFQKVIHLSLAKYICSLKVNNTKTTENMHLKHVVDLLVTHYLLCHLTKYTPFLTVPTHDTVLTPSDPSDCTAHPGRRQHYNPDSRIISLPTVQSIREATCNKAIRIEKLRTCILSFVITNKRDCDN
jgi:hypothetical protein